MCSCCCYCCSSSWETQCPTRCPTSQGARALSTYSGTTTTTTAPKHRVCFRAICRSNNDGLRNLHLGIVPDGYCVRSHEAKSILYVFSIMEKSNHDSLMQLICFRVLHVLHVVGTQILLSRSVFVEFDKKNSYKF